MRLMKAFTAPINEYDSVAEATRGAAMADSLLRTISNDQIRGKTIRQMFWDDGALTFVLKSGQYLNIMATDTGIACSLDDTSVVDVNSVFDEEVHLQLDGGGDVIPWDRAGLRDKFVGRELKQLQFDCNLLWIYIQSEILACFLVKSDPEEIPWLHWSESE